jgi:hypothetical protein
MSQGDKGSRTLCTAQIIIKYTPCIMRPKQYALFRPAYTPKWRIFSVLGVYSRALLAAHRGRAPLIYSSRGPSRRCTGYDSVAHPVICFSELGVCRGLVCVGLAARPRAPGCRPRRGSTFSRGSKTYAQGVCFWVYMEVLEGISSFKRPTTACLRGCAAVPGSDSGQRPRPGLATSSGDICSRPLPRPLWK